MSVIIKGMNMPKNCLLCPCCVGEGTGMGRQHYCQAIDDEPYVCGNCRPENCPLSEIPTPHGRLIDADVIMDLLERSVPEENRGHQFYVFRHMLRNAPTVIEVGQGDG